MHDRYKTDLMKAALLLHTIRSDPDRLDLVLALQQQLIRQITRLERRSKRVQRAAKNMRQTLSTTRPAREQAKALKERIKDCPALLEKIRHQMFIWRCFGDGIAFAYQSKYALKHLYFDRNYNVKPTAGFLSGKTGFRLEWKMVRLGIEMGVPVVLADITNVIRCGDICALGGPDPFPVELKSGKGRNGRTGRQFAYLHEVACFFENDGAPTFRGLTNVQRIAIQHPEVSYLAEVNACITESRTSGFASVGPEAGLRYVAIRDSTPQALEHMGQYISKYTASTMLTPEADWLPAHPFTLSLDAANLLDFIHGQVTVVVLIDLMVIKGIFQEMGVHCIFLMDGTYSMQICKNPDNLDEGVFRLSDLLFARVATEFQSLAWFAKEHSRALNEAPISMSLEDAKNIPGFGRRPPTDWHTVKDFFDTAGAEAASDD